MTKEQLTKEMLEEWEKHWTPKNNFMPTSALRPDGSIDDHKRFIGNLIDRAYEEGVEETTLREAHKDFRET